MRREPLPGHRPPWMTEREWLVLTMRATGATLRATADATGYRWPERIRQIEARLWRRLAARRRHGESDDYEPSRAPGPEWGELPEIFPRAAHPLHGPICVALMHAGLVTRAAIAATSDADLLALRQVGRVSVARVRAVVPPAIDKPPP